MKRLRKTRLGLTYLWLFCARFGFWMLVLMLILVALRTILPGKPARVMEYGALVNNIDAGNVVSATFTKLKSGEELRGELRTPAESFRTVISTDQIDDLTTRLRSRGRQDEYSQRDSFRFTRLLGSIGARSVTCCSVSFFYLDF